MLAIIDTIQSMYKSGGTLLYYLLFYLMFIWYPKKKNLWCLLLMIAPLHQTKTPNQFFVVGSDWILDFLFNHLRLYQLI